MGHSTTVLGLKPVGSTVRYSSYSLRRVPSSTLRPISACMYPTYSSVLGRGRVRRSTFLRRVPLRTPSVLAVLAPERSARIRTRHIFKEISRIFSDDITKAHAHDSATALASLAATPIVQSESRSAELIERERHRALRRPHPHPTRSDTSLPRTKARLLLSAEAATRRCFGRSTTTEESSTCTVRKRNKFKRPTPSSSERQAAGDHK